MRHCNQHLAKKTKRKGVEHKNKRKPKATSKKGEEKKPLRIKVDDSFK
jgi:hypothetical protein